MNWKIDFFEDLQIVQLAYFGVIDVKELLESSKLGVEEGQKRGTKKFLVDAKEFESSMSVFDVLQLPDELFTSWGVKYDNRTALVVPKSQNASGLVRFFEIACQNRGWVSRVFSDRQGAIDWLSEIQILKSPV